MKLTGKEICAHCNNHAWEMGIFKPLIMNGKPFCHEGCYLAYEPKEEENEGHE